LALLGLVLVLQTGQYIISLLLCFAENAFALGLTLNHLSMTGLFGVVFFLGVMALGAGAVTMGVTPTTAHSSFSHEEP
jgi:hypothetical protein